MNRSSNDQSVFLAPQDIHLYQNPLKEPAYVTTIEPIESLVWVDSQNTDGLDNTKSIYHPSGGSIGTNVRRITIKSIGCLWDSPNVNPRNQNIRFYSTASTLFHTVIVPTGYYATSLDLSAAIVVALNTATGASGLTFSVVPIALHPDAYTLSAVGPGDWYFDPTCDAVVKGEQLWNFPYQYTPITSCRIGTMFLMYTKYIDVVSRAITKDAKMRSITSGNIANVAIRFYIPGNTKPGATVVYAPTSDLHFAHRTQSPLYEIDFLWLDQNGDQLYVNTPETFSWDLNMGLEG